MTSLRRSTVWLCVLLLLLAAHCPDERAGQTIEIITQSWLEASEAFARWTEREAAAITNIQDNSEAERRFRRMDRVIGSWQELREAFEAALAINKAGNSTESSMLQILESGRQILKTVGAQ